MTAEGELDLRGTLGIDPDVPVGFDAIRLRFAIEAPNATAEELETLVEKTVRYCVVLQTLHDPPQVDIVT